MFRGYFFIFISELFLIIKLLLVVFKKKNLVTFYTHSEVTLAETRAALQSLDPAKPPGELHALLARGFQLDIEQVPEAGEASTPVAQLAERLRNGDTQRTGPKPA